MADDDVEPAATPPESTGGGFNWGLTPGGATPKPATPEPAAAAEPPALVAPPAETTPATPPGPQPWDTPTVASPVTPPPAWDTPTVATAVQNDPPATVAFTDREVVRQEFPGFGTSIDPALEGVTEAYDAQPVGIGVPENENVEVSALDSLFGESSFVEYEDALIPVLPPRASGGGGGELVVVDRPRIAEARGSIGRTQKVLMGVAGGLVAVLLLVVLYLAGSRIAANSPAAAVVEPSPSASAIAGPVVGPVAPGEYYWDRLLGGECIAPFASAWEDTFVVVDCGQSHAAQLLLKGAFPATEDPAYPGGDALQKLAASLCTVPTVIDYAAAASANDIQITSSFAADQADWDAGNRNFYCFASRTGGAELTTSIAQPQVAPTPAP